MNRVIFLFTMYLIVLLSCNKKSTIQNNSPNDIENLSKLEMDDKMIEDDLKPASIFRTVTYTKKDTNKKGSFFSNFSKPPKKIIDTVLIDDNLLHIQQLTITSSGDTCNVFGYLQLNYDNVLSVNPRHGKYIRKINTMQEEGTFHRGAKIGWWYESTQNKSDSIFYNFKIKPTKYFKTYYPDGSLYLKGKFLNGKKHGQWKSFHQNGNVQKIVPYISGTCDTIVETFNSDGSFKSRKSYKSNMLNGLFEKYDSQGRLTYKANNVNDTISGTTYTYMYHNNSCTINTILDGNKEGIELRVKFDTNDVTKFQDTLHIKPYVSGLLHGKSYFFKNNLRSESNEYHMGLQIGMTTSEHYGVVKETYYSIDRDKEGKLISIVDKRITYYKNSPKIRLSHIRVPDIGIEVTFYNRNGEITSQYITHY